jgi:hypothetical protein
MNEFRYGFNKKCCNTVDREKISSWTNSGMVLARNAAILLTEKISSWTNSGMVLRQRKSVHERIQVWF